MKIVILAGGFGTRLSEETIIKPKPMVEIGNKPIIWHIMKYFSYYGYNEFVIALGYKAEVIKDYFQNENLDVLEEYTDQPELVQFMIMEISTPDEDGTQLEDETAIQLFISCIAMIKLLN